MPILIADSGATKTDWLYSDGHNITHITTQGLHPSNIQQMDDTEDIRTQIGSLSPNTIWFFGTGCGNPMSDGIIRRFLQTIFPSTTTHIHSDLEGSGRAFFGTSEGVVAVLGTGSVCAKMNNGNIAKKSAALGFAIGDEGSAADLGKRILKMYFRNTGQPETIKFIAKKLNHTDYPTMMNRIYGAGKLNRELASIAGEVLQKPLPTELTTLIKNSFSDFADKQLSMLHLSGEEPIIFTGKVAKIHQHLLIPILKNKGYTNVSIRYPVIASWRDLIKTGNIDQYL